VDIQKLSLPQSTNATAALNSRQFNAADLFELVASRMTETPSFILGI
jgi:hypothetical protein